MPSSLSPAEQAEKYNVSVGQLVGNYRLERLIDEGGMGAVFVAVHKDIGRRAAVKVLMRSYAADAEFSIRFLNEARAVNMIGHPGVVEVFEFGRLNEETPYIIMEYLAGESIQARMSAGGKRDFRTSLEWCRQIALALSAAHKRGIIHRDLKPQNVFLIPDPLAPGGERVKILDFGIAKLSDGAQSNGQPLTRTGATMGSPLYMAPEQCYEMGTVTDRADVYGLGILLYELLAGRLPFVSEFPAEVMVMQVKNTPPPLKTINSAIPASIIAIVDVMLQKAPTMRPSMEEVAQRLERLLAASGLTGAWQSVKDDDAKAKGGHVLLIAGGIFIALCVLTLGVFWLRGPPWATSPNQPKKPPLAATGNPQTQGQTDTSALRAPKPPAAPIVKTIHHELTSEPPGAKVIDGENGEELGNTPITLNLPRSLRPLKLTLRRSGYQERALLIDRTQDGSTEQKLVPVPAKKPKVTTPSPQHEELLAPQL